jgi:hypothetical protein
VSFEVSADDYLRFMGPYSQPLAARFCDLAGYAAGRACWTWAAGRAR